MVKLRAVVRSRPSTEDADPAAPLVGRQGLVTEQASSDDGHLEVRGERLT